VLYQTLDPKRLAHAALAILLIAQAGLGCSFVDGYFYQVSSLRGTVVGTKLHRLPRWLRQSFAMKHTKLPLYEYRRPSRPSDQPLVRVLETDDDGRFDFGPLRTGHYELVVGEEWSYEVFDVEVKPLLRETDSVTVDASPILPDCTGGHEFIIRSK